MKHLASKTCAACKQAKPLECFGQSSHFSDGLKTLCRGCAGDYYRAWKARRVAAHAGWLAEKGLAWRAPGVASRAPSRFLRPTSREQKST